MRVKGTCFGSTIIGCVLQLGNIWDRRYNRNTSSSKRCFRTLSVIIATVVGLCWLCISAVPLSNFCDVSSFLPPGSTELYATTQAFRLVSGYGLFRHMTGVSPSMRYPEFRTNSKEEEEKKKKKKKKKNYKQNESNPRYKLKLPPSGTCTLMASMHHSPYSFLILPNFNYPFLTHVTSSGC
jgi:hypothetical protein